MSDSTGNYPAGGEPPRDEGHGQQPTSPYGQPAYGQPTAGQQYDLPAYGQDPDQPPYGQQPYGGHPPPHAPDRRPGSVTAAGVITLVFSGLSLAVFGLLLVALAVARDEMVEQMSDEPALGDVNANDIVSVMLVVFVVFVVWCILAMVLAVFAMRRSNGARIGLVVSAAIVAVLSLLGIQSLVSALTLAAAIAVIVCLFVGGAGQWYAGKDGYPGQPTPSGPIA